MINTSLQGDFRSVFKGSGLDFHEVRSYQYGDDVKSINWNVSAKGHGIFVNTFKEEKDQLVMFFLDVSASQQIGNTGSTKMDRSKELAILLGLSSMDENSRTGLVCFSDTVEHYMKPSKGPVHYYDFTRSIINLTPRSRRTSIVNAIKFGQSVLKKKGIVFFISDFLDGDYFPRLRSMALKHDVILIHLFDRREVEFPKLGIIPLKDKESGRTVWQNTSSGRFQKKIAGTYKSKSEDLEQFCRENNINYLHVDTREDYIPKLISLFSARNRSKSRVR